MEDDERQLVDDIEAYKRQMIIAETSITENISQVAPASAVMWIGGIIAVSGIFINPTLGAVGAFAAIGGWAWKGKASSAIEQAEKNIRYARSNKSIAERELAALRAIEED